MDLQHRLGARIRAFRKRRGWSQEDLAEHAGLSEDTVSAWERGKSLPSIKLLIAAAEALAVPVEAFFGAPEETESTKRAELLARLTDAARDLPDETLEYAAETVEGLARLRG